MAVMLSPPAREQTQEDSIYMRSFHMHSTTGFHGCSCKSCYRSRCRWKWYRPSEIPTEFHPKVARQDLKRIRYYSEQDIIADAEQDIIPRDLVIAKRPEVKWASGLEDSKMQNEFLPSFRHSKSFPFTR